MDYRKLIKFGNSSYVVSLPKSWTEKNNLKKGDTIYLEENGNNELILLPKEIKNENEKREIIIDVNGKDIKLVNREIVAAYINNFDTIKVIGRSIADYSTEIRNRVQNLMACEVLEQGENYILCKDFLKVSELSYKELTRKIDIIVKSMFLDLRNIDDKIDIVPFKNRSDDANKISFVIYRILKLITKNNYVNKTLDTSPLDLLHWWYFAMKIEHIAEGIRDICYYISLNKISKDILKKSEFKAIIMHLSDLYDSVTKSFYKNDHLLALTISDIKYKFDERCDNYLKQHKDDSSLIEKFKSLMKEINRIARWVYSN
ncbi:phosphate uptake regulator PhoU [Candidatus Woesearchaeota archaeon]|nr:phosphate uptake regulator PhoU [Candidatus Woesearchaeota archaeon]